MKDIELIINEDGTIQSIKNEGEDFDLFDAESEVNRASHVEPVNRTLRRAFHFLRKVFGENGRVGNWTRRWKCEWRIDMSPVGGMVFYGFASRADAIAYEVMILKRMMEVSKVEFKENNEGH